jgi:uncharacterized ion transporter superfamily protein YfcC
MPVVVASPRDRRRLPTFVLVAFVLAAVLAVHLWIISAGRWSPARWPVYGSYHYSHRRTDSAAGN